MKTMKLGVYTRYTPLGASSRLRFYAYADFLRDAGFEAEFHPFFSDAYLRRLYRGGGKSRIEGIHALLRRGAIAPFLPENLLIEYELFPELPYGVEKHFLAGRRYVLNFDDDVWLKYAGRPRLEGKFDELVRRAQGVIAANDHLLEKLRPLQPRLLKIPTAVDLAPYRATREKFPVFTVAWIGTPVTYQYLEMHAEHLRAMAARVPFELLVIAKRELAERAIPGVQMRFEEWSPETEAKLLSQSHLGIMPLPPEDAFAAGKSAFKLIQYLAAGIPAIATPLGENRLVLEEGQTGFFATHPDEWAEAALRLASDTPLRESMAEAARAAAPRSSLERYAPQLTGFLTECFAE